MGWIPVETQTLQRMESEIEKYREVLIVIRKALDQMRDKDYYCGQWEKEYYLIQKVLHEKASEVKED